MKNTLAVLAVLAVLVIIATFASCSSKQDQTTGLDALSGKIVKRVGNLPFPIVSPSREQGIREKLRAADNVFVQGRKVLTKQPVAAVCGDGTTAGSEQCDAGALNNVVCAPGYGSSCSYCSSSCTNVILDGGRCGDTTVNGPEECDDGNVLNTDSCLATCRDAICGDGFIKTSNEECDDGNTNSGDWCSPTCRFSSPEGD